MLISGPVNLNVLYSKKDKHYVYIFGDMHEDLKYLCDNKQNLIWEFLYNLIKKNPSKLFNVLIETYQIDDDTNNTFNNKDVIYHIINKFKCFSKEKNKKQFINAMIHYVDYRIMTSFGFVANKFHINYKNSYEFFNHIEVIDNNMLNLLLNYYNNKKDLDDLYLYTSTIYNILLQFKHNININTINEYVGAFKEFINYSKIDKQFSNIHNNNYIKILYNYSNTFFQYILNKYQKIQLNVILHIFENILNDWNVLKKKKHIYTENQINLLYAFYEFNFEIQLILMDLYAMGRLLRHFDEYDLPDFKNNDKYSVFYVGGKHAVLYIKLLQQMDFEIIHKSTNFNKKKRCIEIDDKVFSDFNL